MNTNIYAITSLELHLFFGRIMKEHSLFLKAGFTPADAAFAKKAEHFRQQFEELLCRAIPLSDGIVREEVLKSGELVTEFTAPAEEQTECFTGIAINRAITAREHRLNGGDCRCAVPAERCAQIRRLNQTALSLLDGLIAFKQSILNRVCRCEMFTMNYPLLIEHIIREAKLYRKYIATLEQTCELSDQTMKDTECFWNQIMMEHAMFIRGLLDPTETALFDSADSFAKEYTALLENCRGAHSRTLKSDSLEATRKFRDFKAAGAAGITECKIRSVIMPLLADHVLREANHYLRLLEC